MGQSEWYEDRTDGLYESAISIRVSEVKFREDQADVEELLTINDVKFNVLHTCLILETIATYATYLGTDFQPYLLNTLHRLLEKSGSSHYMIHSAGAYALSKLKSALQLSSITELIYQNADYIIFHVNKSLRKANESKSALDILSVVIKYSSLDSIPHLENIIVTVLDESAKGYQLQNILSFLKVFYMILQGIREWLKQNVIENAEEVTNSDQNPNPNFHTEWLNILRREDKFDEIVDDETDTINMNYEEKDGEEYHEDVNEKKPVEKPVFVEFTIKILNRCVRYVSSKNRDEKLVALDTICIGFDIIKAYENDLLPMVHSMWQPFAQRVKDNDPVILRKCFAVLNILATYAKDFMYHRTSK